MSTNSFPKFKKEIMGKFAPRRIRPKKEEAEFGAGKKEYLVCPKCSAAYYGKCWHHRLGEGKHFKHEERKKLNFVLCPACKMIKEKKFEGSVEIKNVPVKIAGELVNLIKNSAKVAFSKDPMDRVIEIRRNKNNILVTATENQLAKKIAKLIKRAFKNYARDCEITMSDEEDIVRIVIDFQVKTEK